MGSAERGMRDAARNSVMAPCYEMLVRRSVVVASEELRDKEGGVRKAKVMSGYQGPSHAV